ncbi:MAG: DeoR/GlpR family DNA-binding transcription regulator [Rhodobacter sp.]|nr:DeoR/GlpR family DNA-binding transcription regulator [Rhodobacter sp.]
MAQTLRQTEILDLARQSGQVSVEALADRFGVSLQTIRRDLGGLADAGELERVHGGAVLRAGLRNIGYEERRRLNAPEKRAIAKACVAKIPPGASVFLNIGTTTEAVAQALVTHSPLLAVTNNLNVANVLAGNPACEIIVAGGTLRRSDGGLVGPLAQRAVGQFKVDVAVIGCSALDRTGDLLDYDLQEIAVSQTIITQARQVFLVADHSKFQRAAPARIASLEQIDRVFTDRAMPPETAERCAAWQTDVEICAPV